MILAAAMSVMLYWPGIQTQLGPGQLLQARAYCPNGCDITWTCDTEYKYHLPCNDYALGLPICYPGTYSVFPNATENPDLNGFFWNVGIVLPYNNKCKATLLTNGGFGARG